jgi:hypothetical protein
MNIKEAIIDVLGSRIRIAVQNSAVGFDYMLCVVIGLRHGSVVVIFAFDIDGVIHRFVKG